MEWMLEKLMDFEYFRWVDCTEMVVYNVTHLFVFGKKKKLRNKIVIDDDKKTDTNIP